MTTTVEGTHGQTIFDLCLQYYGTLDRIGEVAAANDGIGFGESRIDYVPVKLPELPAVRRDIVDHFTARRRRITTY